MIELIRLYTKKAAELLQAEIIRCGEDAMDTPREPEMPSGTRSLRSVKQKIASFTPSSEPSRCSRL